MPRDVDIDQEDSSLSLIPIHPPSPPAYRRQVSLSPKKLCHNRKQRGEAVGFQSFRMRVFQIMGNRRLHKIERFHIPGTSESERLKVTALNLFHPTAFPPFPKNRFFHIATQSQRREEEG